MTRSSQTVRTNILDFDDDFERNLRRARNQQEHNPPNSESDLEENVQEEEEATAGIFEEDQGMAVDNRTLKELSASGLDNAAPLCIQYPTAAQGKFRDPGQLPSSTIPNPKGGFESAKAILLRSGKEIGAGSTPSQTGPKSDVNVQIEEEESSMPTAKEVPPLPQVPKAPNLSNSANKDAIKQVPRYAKFLKELCTTRKRILTKEVVMGYLEDLNEDVLEKVITQGVEGKNKGADFMQTHGMNDNILAVPPSEELIEVVAALESSPKLDGFYRRFIKDFSKIAQPLCRLLQKEVSFEFNEACEKAFKHLKELLTTAPIITPPDWDKKGCENVVADHLSRLVHEEESLPISETFPDEQLMSIKVSTPWYADLVNFLVSKQVPNTLSKAQRDKLRKEARFYVWDDPYLWKICPDQIVRRCVIESEFHSILSFCHSYACGGHFGTQRTAHKVLECGFHWPTLFKDARTFCLTCDRCQRTGNLGQRDQMPQTPILVVEIFDVWGIDFMGPFPTSFGFTYILLAVDYVSKWVEAKAT
ncbi:uncharacterized protein [Malus domestica]|uniref:uncharacterized protein n=1 Tax=Malus domestica TaxID=3750 RepID=UPI003974FEF1